MPDVSAENKIMKKTKLKASFKMRYEKAKKYQKKVIRNA